MKKVKIFLMLGIINLCVLLVGCSASNKKQVPTHEIELQVKENFSKYDCDCSWTAQHSIKRPLHMDSVSVTVKNESYYGYDEDVYEMIYQYDKSVDIWSLQESRLISSKIVFNENLIHSGYEDYVTNLDTWDWSNDDTFIELEIYDIAADSIEIYSCATFENACREDVQVIYNFAYDDKFDENDNIRDEYLEIVQAGEHWEIEDGCLWIYSYGNYPFEVIGGHGYNIAVVEIPVYISEDCEAKAGETETFKVWINIHEGIYQCALQ